MDQKPRGYSCRKWTTFTLSFINLIALIGITVMIIDVTGRAIELAKHHPEFKHNKEKHVILKKGWEMLRTIIIVSTVIIGLVYSFGIFVVFKEHFYLVVAYAVLMSITTILYMVAKFMMTSLYLALFALNLPLCVFAFYFAFDLRKHKRRYLANNLSTVSQPQILGHYPAQSTTLPMQTLCPDSLPPPGYDWKANVPQTTH